MAGFNPFMLSGAAQGAGQAQEYQNNQILQQMNQQKLQQALQQMAQEQQARQAQQQALKGLSTTQGQGPGNTITPQQLAGLTQNPEAFAALNAAVRPANQGMYGLQRTDIQQQGANQRNENTVSGAMDRTQTQQQGANERAGQANQTREAIVDKQQTGANARNANTVSAKKNSITNPVNLASLPEYKTAKSEYEEAKKDERNIEAHYPNIAQAYSDPQWLDARKRSVAAQGKMEAIKSKAAKTEAAADAPATPQIPPEAVKQLKEGVVTTFGNGQKWTLTNGQPAQVQ